jgi:hypothetical protein
MSKIVTAVLSVLALSAAAGPSPESQLKEKDQENLGKLIGEYFDAKRESSGVADSLEDLSDAIAKLEKKSKGVPVLAMVEDLQKAVYFSRKYKDSVPKGRSQSVKYPSAYDDEELEYVVHAPKSYKSSKGPYPLILCLPDSGESAPEEAQAHLDKHWTDADIREGAILAACTMPTDRATWNELKGAVGNAMLALRDVKASYAVDIDRVYIAGRGASVATAMKAAEIFPHVFAGVIGRAGDVGETRPANFRNLPTFFAGGGANCTAFEQAAKAEGIGNCTVQADATEADIWTWIQAHPRTPHPLEVTLAPVIRTSGTAYWVQARGFDPDESPYLHARVERDKNTIHIEASDIASVYVYFNDILVDMSAPIHVIANGVDHEVTLPRRLEVALEQAYTSGDGGRIYTNSHYFDLPGAATDGDSESGAKE